MKFLDNLQIWIEETTFYNNFLTHMPAPLNNIYFDTVLLAIILIYCGYRIIDGVRMAKRHRAVKERQLELQLELKEKLTENEISRINSEKDSRNQREDMSQLMDFMKISMLANTTNKGQNTEHVAQTPQNFEQYKEQEYHVNLARNSQKTQEAFDTIDVVSDNNNSFLSVTDTSVYNDMAASESTRLENERITAELMALRIENECIKNEYTEKEKERENVITRIKEAMIQKENEKQLEIDKLAKDFASEKENNQKHVDTMISNLNIYKETKEKEINDLTLKSSTAVDNKNDDQQAEIIRLTNEMNSMKKMQEQDIAKKEEELARIAAEKENMIKGLTAEISNIRSKNDVDIDKLTSTLQDAHATQKAIEEAKVAEIEELNAEINRMKLAKELEIAAIKTENEKEVSGLRISLTEVMKKADALGQMSQKREDEIAKLQNTLLVADKSNTSEYTTLTQKIETLKTEYSAVISDKKVVENEISTLKTQLSDAQTSSQKQIIEKQSELNTLSDTKPIEKLITAEKIDMRKEKTIEKSILQASSSEVNQSSIPQNIAKPNFYNNTSVNDTLSDFDKMIAQFENTEAKSQALEDVRKSSEEKIKTNKEALEQQLIIEAKNEHTQTTNTEDDIKLEAINAQKKKALEIAKREEAKRIAEEERLKKIGTKKKKGLLW